MCLYATRLFSNSSIMAEPSLTPAQLMIYRQRIHEVLLSFHTISDPNVEQQIQLPRMINSDGFEERRLEITFGSAVGNDVVLHTSESVIDTVKKMRLSTDNDFEILESEQKNPSEMLCEQASVSDVKDEYSEIKKRCIHVSQTTA